MQAQEPSDQDQLFSAFSVPGASAHVSLAGEGPEAAKRPAAVQALAQLQAEETARPLGGRDSIEQLLVDEIERERQRELGEEAAANTVPADIQRMLSSLEAVRGALQRCRPAHGPLSC